MPALDTTILDLNPIGDVAAVAICPHCGHHNEIKWERNQLVWWIIYGHCVHYEGAYHTGNPSTVEARFWGGR